MAPVQRTQFATAFAQEGFDLSTSQSQPISTRVPSTVLQDEFHLFFADTSLPDPFSGMESCMHFVLSDYYIAYLWLKIFCK